jgi:hypothetical protein
VAAAIVTLSAAAIATMITSIVLGPYGDQVLARDGYSNRDHDAPDSSGVIGAILSPAPRVEETALPAPSWTREQHASRRIYTDRSRPYQRTSATRWASASVAGPTRGHSVCVRLCDGFFFPVGDVHGSGDIDTQTAVCSSACPGAPTRLFIVPSSSSEMDRATAVQTGQPYTALPVAFAHTKEVGPTCTCHAEGQAEAALMTPVRDITMRDGDTVMTSAGWRVFKSNGHWPYTRRNFTDLASAKDMPNSRRSTLLAMENASLGRAGPAPATVRSAILDIRAGRHAVRLKDADGRMVRMTGTDQAIYR